MPYVTFAEVKEFKRGPNEMKRLLEGHAADLANLGNNDAPHPFFDLQQLAVEQEVNDALKAAGLEYPLGTITDTRLKNASIYRLVDLLTRGRSNREPGDDALKALADDYFKELHAGGTLTVLDVEPSPVAAKAVTGRRVDLDVFDTADGILDSRLFPDLGRGNFPGWRR